ncbi:hypothetical protein SCCGRSA3_02610 [Marine Group I thaumarchaeote SCGC RSA3]|uniref:Peptidase S74 domain-containing protein n=1 Tax=Marine Group I thaumarchaeote SCGC RSA3 TaxID=1503183 RepID=A0A087RQF8_9ARCH|nr:hypothetical protein SCCGRSA3_02610 [Marine Group I thaumarchaeote SCGC RSA3]
MQTFHLNTFNDNLNFTDAIYLQVIVKDSAGNNPETLTPRLKIVGAPFALSAARASVNFDVNQKNIINATSVNATAAKFESGTGTSYDTVLNVTSSSGTNQAVVFLRNLSGMIMNVTNSGNLLFGANSEAINLENGDSFAFDGNDAYFAGLLGVEDDIVSDGNVNATGAMFTTGNAVDVVLNVTNTGTGESFRVNDAASPDTTPFVIDAAGSVGIGTADPAAPLHVLQSASTVARFERTTNDGTIIEFSQDATIEGSISVTGATVSYNAFTGSHYAQSDQTIERGLIVEMTGENGRLNESPGSEILYGIKVSDTPNNPKILGSYLDFIAPSTENSVKPHHLVMAVGNGDMWIVDNGEDLDIGDYLISSSTPGHAQKDTAMYPVSNVIARVTEPVNWNDVSETINGIKHKKIMVTFESFEKQNYELISQDQQSQIEAQQLKIQDLEAQIASLKAVICSDNPNAVICSQQ